jgi:hypothetical protein
LGDRPPAPVDVVNDTDSAVEISIMNEGEELEPESDDPRIEAGGRATYDMSLIAFDEELGDRCTDGPLVARYDDGTEIQVAPPVCVGATIILSLYATAFEITNDTGGSVSIWVKHGGDLYVPTPGDRDLEPQESARYALIDSYSEIVDDGRLCIDGEVVARTDDGADLLLSGPVCDGDSHQVSEFVGS